MTGTPLYAMSPTRRQVSAMRKFLLLIAAPLPVWIAWGVALLLRPGAALDMFPYFWFANDVALVLMFVAMMLWVVDFGKPQADEGSPPAAPSRRPARARGTPSDAGLNDAGADLAMEASP